MNLKWPPECAYILGILIGALWDDSLRLFARPPYIVITKWLIIGGTYYLCRHLANWIWTRVAAWRRVTAMPREQLLPRS